MNSREADRGNGQYGLEEDGQDQLDEDGLGGKVALEHRWMVGVAL